MGVITVRLAAVADDDDGCTEYSLEAQKSRQAATPHLSLRRTPLLSRQNPVEFKRRRRCIVYNDTVDDRAGGFTIEARTKFARFGKGGVVVDR